MANVIYKIKMNKLKCILGGVCIFLLGLTVNIDTAHAALNCYACGMGGGGQRSYSCHSSNPSTTYCGLVSSSSCGGCTTSASNACYFCGGSQGGIYKWGSYGDGCSKQSAYATEASCLANNCLYKNKETCESSTNQTCLKDSTGCWVGEKTSGDSCVGIYETENACYAANSSSKYDCVRCKHGLKYAAIAKTPTYYPPGTDTNEIATVIKYYTITYKLNGGKFINGSTEDRTTYIAENKVIGEFKTNPIKDGYKFKEWQLNGNKFTDFDKKPTADITLEAVYEEVTEDDKKYYCEDGYILDSSTNVCYKVLKADGTNTYDYTKYSYAAGQTFCYAYSASANRAGGVNPKSGINATTTGKNNVTYDGYDSQDAWVSKDTCKFGTECKEAAGTTRPACETIWSAIIFSKKDAEISVSFDKTLNIDTSESQIRNISAGTKLSTVSSKITTVNSTKNLLDKKGKKIENSTTSLAKTGEKISITRDDGTTITYTLSVKGDPSGDGIVDITDLIKTARELNTYGQLEGAYFTAADVKEDGTVDITDITQIAKKVNGKEVGW